MIKNEQQLQAAQEKLSRIEADVRGLTDPDAGSPLRDMADSLREEIGDYLVAKSGMNNPVEVDELDSLGTALIHLRISRRMSQAALAERLGVQEQQVQRWEAREYEQAKLWVMAEVLDALGYTCRISLLPPAGTAGRNQTTVVQADGPGWGGWRPAHERDTSTISTSTSRCDNKLRELA